MIKTKLCESIWLSVHGWFYFILSLWISLLSPLFMHINTHTHTLSFVCLLSGGLWHDWQLWHHQSAAAQQGHPLLLGSDWLLCVYLSPLSPFITALWWTSVCVRLLVQNTYRTSSLDRLPECRCMCVHAGVFSSEKYNGVKLGGKGGWCKFKVRQVVNEGN